MPRCAGSRWLNRFSEQAQPELLNLSAPVAEATNDLMHIATRLRLAAIVCALCSMRSLSIAGPKPALSDADTQWLSVTQLLAPAPAPGASVTRTQNGARISAAPPESKATADKKNNDRRSGRKAAAAAAAAFYKQFPNDPRVPEAKKIEALAGLMSIADSDDPNDATAVKVAEAYCKDKSNAAASRFEVALASERVQARAKLGGVYGNNAAELANIAAKLQKEFGDLPDLFQFEANIARNADNATASQLAQAIIQSPHAPDSVVSDARETIDRLNLLGARLHVVLPTADGKGLDLTQQRGKRTLLYIWSAQMSGPFADLTKASAALPSDVEVIYVRAGANAGSVAPIDAPPTPGRQCFDLTGAKSSVLQQLKVQTLPYVFVLNADGTVAGFGPTSQISALVALAR
jgi:hypothetical protein